MIAHDDKLTAECSEAFHIFLSLKTSTSLMSSELICGAINFEIYLLFIEFPGEIKTSTFIGFFSHRIATIFTCSSFFHSYL